MTKKNILLVALFLGLIGVGIFAAQTNTNFFKGAFRAEAPGGGTAEFKQFIEEAYNYAGSPLYTADKNETLKEGDGTYGDVCITFTDLYDKVPDFECPVNWSRPRGFENNAEITQGEAAKPIYIRSNRGSLNRFSAHYNFFIYNIDTPRAAVPLYGLDGDLNLNTADDSGYNYSEFFPGNTWSAIYESGVNRYIDGVWPQELDPGTYELVAVRTMGGDGTISNSVTLSNTLTIEILPRPAEESEEETGGRSTYTPGTFDPPTVDIEYVPPTATDTSDFETTLIVPSAVWNREHTAMSPQPGATEDIPNLFGNRDTYGVTDPVVFVASNNFITRAMEFEIVHRDIDTGVQNLAGYYAWEATADERRAPIFRVEWDGHTCGRYTRDKVKTATYPCANGPYIIRVKSKYPDIGFTAFSDWYQVGEFWLTDGPVPGSERPEITVTAPDQIDISTISPLGITQSELTARGGILPNDGPGPDFSYNLNFDAIGVFGFIMKDEDLKASFIETNMPLNDIIAASENFDELTDEQKLALIESIRLGYETPASRNSSFNWDGQTCVNYPGGPVNLEDCETGVYEFYVYSANQYGDTVIARTAFRVVDNTVVTPTDPPVPTFERPLSGSTVTPTVHTDGTKTTEVRVNTDIPASCFYSSTSGFNRNIDQLSPTSDNLNHSTTINVIDGTNTAYVKCTSDTSARPNTSFTDITHTGSMSSAISTTFTVGGGTDTTAPNVSIVTPANGSTVTPDATSKTELLVTTSEAATCFYSDTTEFTSISKLLTTNSLTHRLNINVNSGTNTAYVKCTDDTVATTDGSTISHTGNMSSTVNTTFRTETRSDNQISCDINYVISNTQNDKFDPDTEKVRLTYNFDNGNLTDSVDAKIRLRGPLDLTADEIINDSMPVDITFYNQTVNESSLPVSGNFEWEGRGPSNEILEDGVYVFTIDVNRTSDRNYECNGENVRPILIEHTNGTNNPIMQISARDTLVRSGDDQIITFRNFTEARKVVINLYRTDQTDPISTAYYYCGPGENCPEKQSTNLSPSTKSISVPFQFFSEPGKYYFKASLKTKDGKIYKVSSNKFEPESGTVYLPQCNFADVNPSDPRYSDIIRVCEVGIMVGSTDPYNPGLRIYNPYQVTNRIEGITIANNISACYGGTYNPRDGDLGFIDMQQFVGDSRATWMFEQIMTGIRCLNLSGYADGTMRPTNELSQAEAWKIVIEAIQSSGLGRFNPIYADTRRDPWWTDYEFFLRQNGFGLPNPTQKITRAEMASFIAEMERKGLVEFLLPY